MRKTIILAIATTFLAGASVVTDWHCYFGASGGCPPCHR
jgi:hypothetical protein